jgi:hypothetical protein
MIRTKVGWLIASAVFSVGRLLFSWHSWAGEVFGALLMLLASLYLANDIYGSED